MAEKKFQDNLINIQPSLSFSLCLAQIFGVFPIYGITDPDIKSLNFSWLSFRTIYSLLHTLLVVQWCIFSIAKLLFMSSQLADITNVVFMTSALLASILFLKLVREWPDFMTKWHNVEINMGSIGTTINLKRKLMFLTISFFVMAAVEHFFIPSYKVVEVLERCEHDCVREYFTAYYFQEFSITEYALWKGIYLQIIMLRSTFTWTYVDVFLILISTAFVSRMRQLVEKVNTLLQAKSKNPVIWKKLREEHYNLYKLCMLMDNRLSLIILLSFATNLYFVLVQLFGSTRNFKDIVREVYYFISFGFLLLRLLGVCLFGASINDEGKKILPLLLSVPSSCYTLEIERFTDQVIKNPIVISGKNFFKLTRGLILNIAGAIVTYELALWQFSTYLTQANEN